MLTKLSIYCYCRSRRHRRFGRLLTLLVLTATPEFGIVASEPLNCAVDKIVQAADQPVVCALTYTELPEDRWQKARLKPTLLNDSTLRLHDVGHGQFDDASFWELSLPVNLPFGRKVLTFEVKVADSHRALWGKNLLQPMINGKEAAPAMDENGVPRFSKVIAADGKGFITVDQSTIAFEIDKTVRTLSSFSFMTAGAAGFDMVLSNPSLTVWPEVDDQIYAQRPRITELGFLPGMERRLLIDWHNDASSMAADTVRVTLTDPAGNNTEHELNVPLRGSEASGSRVSQLVLDNAADNGVWTLQVPSLGPRTSDATATFALHDSNAPLTAARDAAWGAFYWIDSTDNGPYPTAHPQDERAALLENEAITRDVSGGWFDAGDYGKYSVNTAYSVSTWLLTGLLAPDAVNHAIEPLAPKRSADGIPDWLILSSVGLDWLLTMQDSDSGGVHHKATTRDWPSMQDAPIDDARKRWILPISSTATADFAAVMSLAAYAYQQPHLGGVSPLATKRAQQYEAAALRAIQWLDANPQLRMVNSQYDNADYGGPYDDTDDKDERVFAQAAFGFVVASSGSIHVLDTAFDARSIG